MSNLTNIMKPFIVDKHSQYTEINQIDTIDISGAHFTVKSAEQLIPGALTLISGGIRNAFFLGRKTSSSSGWYYHDLYMSRYNDLLNGRSTTSSNIASYDKYLYGMGFVKNRLNNKIYPTCILIYNDYNGGKIYSRLIYWDYENSSYYVKIFNYYQSVGYGDNIGLRYDPVNYRFIAYYASGGYRAIYLENWISASSTDYNNAFEDIFDCEYNADTDQFTYRRVLPGLMTNYKHLYNIIYFDTQYEKYMIKFNPYYTGHCKKCIRDFNYPSFDNYSVVYSPMACTDVGESLQYGYFQYMLFPISKENSNTYRILYDFSKGNYIKYYKVKV